MKPRIRSLRIGSGGQATTEVVLLMPLFMFFLFAFAKIFAVLLLTQKMEIASYYAARRWQLESHRAVKFEGFDTGTLKSDIQDRVNKYLGFTGQGKSSVASFLGITGPAQLTVTPTMSWEIVTIKLEIQPLKMALLKTPSRVLEVTKYVPHRDRPIAFVLPGAPQ